MGIRIASQPVGAPILAATSTAVAQANERRGALQARMFQDEQRRKAIQEERQADREFTLQRDKTAAEEAEKRRQADNAEFDRRDNAYRRKDALGAMYDEVARREKFYSSTPLTPEGMKQRDEAAASLRYIRERQAAGDRPEIIQQYMAQWIAEFDNRNPSAWEDKPKPTIDEFSRNSMYAGPDGRIIPNDSVLSGGAVPGYSRTMDPSTGKWGPWEKWAGAGGVDDREADAKFKWAKGEVDKWVSSMAMEKVDTPENRKKWMSEKLNEYDQMQEMIRSGAYKDGQPGQPAPQQPGQPQPAPQQPAVPGDGQALPVPAAPFQPPTQPLNAGDIVLPGGPSQLAPPPRDYAAEVAAQQSQYGNGQPASAPSTPAGGGESPRIGEKAGTGQLGDPYLGMKDYEGEKGYEKQTGLPLSDSEQSGLSLNIYTSDPKKYEAEAWRVFGTSWSGLTPGQRDAITNASGSRLPGMEDIEYAYQSNKSKYDFIADAVFGKKWKDMNYAERAEALDSEGEGAGTAENMKQQIRNVNQENAMKYASSKGKNWNDMSDFERYRLLQDADDEGEFLGTEPQTSAINPQQFKNEVDRARAASPQNAAKYDAGQAALDRLKSGASLTEEERVALEQQVWDAWNLSQAAGLGMTQ